MDQKKLCTRTFFTQCWCLSPWSCNRGYACIIQKMTKENRIRNVLAKKDLKLESMQLYKGMQLPSKIWNERKPINSTATAFYSLYRVELKNAGKEKHHMRKRTDCLTKRQITFIGMDRMVQRSILLTLSGGGLITSAVAIAIAPNPLLILSHIDRGLN